MRSRFAGVSAVVCAALTFGVAACGSDNNDNSSSSSSTTSSSGASTSSSSAAAGKLTGTIPITSVLDLTGAVAYVGKEEQKAMDLAVEDVNSSGMLGDAKLKLDYKDTGSDQGQAVTQMSSAVKSDSVAVLGPLLSNEALATAPIAQRAKVVDVATQSQNDGVMQIGNYIYRLTTSQLKYDNLIINHLAEKGVKKTNLIYANDNPTLVDVSTRLMKDGMGQVGISIGQNLGIPSATTDFSSITSKLMSGNPDAIGLMLVGVPLSSLTKALRTAGFKGLLYADSAATAGSLAPAGTAADGLFYATDYTEELDFDSSKAFVAKFKAKYPDQQVYGYNASGWDAIHFIAQALAASGKATREGMLEGAQKVTASGSFAGAVGPAKFTDPDKRDIAAPGALVEWRANKEHLLTKGDPSQIVQPLKK